MKVKLTLILTLTLLEFGCTSKLNRLTNGHYESTCFLQRYPTVILRLGKDSMFSYNWAYLDDQVIGEWQLSGDTLFLNSGFFGEEYEKPMTPSYKYTDYPNKKDAFLLKKGKLYKLDSLGHIVQECYLKHFN